jgi:hypothetical protein
MSFPLSLILACILLQISLAAAISFEELHFIGIFILFIASSDRHFQLDIPLSLARQWVTVWSPVSDSSGRPHIAGVFYKEQHVV